MIVTALLFLFLVIRPLYRRYKSPLRKFPGPFVASCTRLWEGMKVPVSDSDEHKQLLTTGCQTAYITWTGKIEQHHIALHKKYGLIDSRKGIVSDKSDTIQDRLFE